MTFESPEAGRKITFRVSDELAEQLDEQENRSAFIRNAIRDALGGTPDELPLEPPDDTQLAKAYRAAVNAANGPFGHPDAILPAVANATNTPQSVVAKTYLKRLEGRGYLRRISDETGRQIRYKVIE